MCDFQPSEFLLLHFPFFLKARNSCLSNSGRPEILECNNGQKLPVGKFMQRMIEPCYRTKQAFLVSCRTIIQNPLKKIESFMPCFTLKPASLKWLVRKFLVSLAILCLIMSGVSLE